MDSTSDTRSLSEETKDLADHASRYYDTLRKESPFVTAYKENPYLVVGAAAGLGYVIAGGLFTPFTSRLTRMSLKALVIPFALMQIKQFTEPAALR